MESRKPPQRLRESTDLSIHFMNQKNVFQKFWPLQKGYKKIMTCRLMKVWQSGRICSKTLRLFFFGITFFFLHLYVFSESFTRAKYSFLIKDASNMEKKSIQNNFLNILVSFLPPSLLSSLYFLFLRGKNI